MKTLLKIALVIGVVILVFWIGLQIPPKPYQDEYEILNEKITTIKLPEGLPQPVEYFYREVYGDRIPVINSAVITGKASMRLPSKGGITFPGRFRFTHNVGKDYWHNIEVSFFGIPIMKVNEYFIDGKSRMELPFGISEGEKIDQGANLALWAEAIWFPSIWLTDPNVTWEDVNETSALLSVPFGEKEEHFLVSFHPETGMIEELESMRFKGTDNEEKTKWTNQPKEWQILNSYLLPSIGEITWEDEGSPWASFEVENIFYNVNLQ